MNYHRSMFYYTKNEIVSGFIAIHVDDILWSGSNNFEYKIIAKFFHNWKRKLNAILISWFKSF